MSPRTALLRLAVASVFGTTVRSDGQAVVAAAESDITQVAIPWTGSTVQDLHREYGSIFKYGNRNAASHRWSTFLLERSAQMTEARLELMFSGFCAVSGSPVRPVDYNRYRLTLPKVGGGRRTGYMHYCCWPCVCDTQDFIRIDTKNITTAEGTRQYHFTVLGNQMSYTHRSCSRSTAGRPPWPRRHARCAVKLVFSREPLCRITDTRLSICSSTPRGTTLRQTSHRGPTRRCRIQHQAGRARAGVVCYSRTSASSQSDAPSVQHKATTPGWARFSGASAQSLRSMLAPLLQMASATNRWLWGVVAGDDWK
jgi:hypothetical protein